MRFRFDNNIEVLMFESPTRPEMICLMAYLKDRPFNHGETTISPRQLVERLRRIEAYDPCEIDIEVNL